jgi:hypothetical protein
MVGGGPRAAWRRRVIANLISAGPEPVWQWKGYRQPGGRIVAIDRAAAQDDARAAARGWIAGQRA